MKNKLTIIVIIILLIFIAFLFNNKNRYNNEKEHVYNVSLIKENKKKYLLEALEKYKNNIITEKKLSINYEYKDVNGSLIGKVYIDNNKLLHITNSNKKQDYIISNIEFETMYTDNNSRQNILIYLISSIGELYYFSLVDNDISNLIINNIELDYKIKNFTNLSFQHDIYGNTSLLFVLNSNNQLIDITSNINYDSSIITLFNKYYIFSDNTISNIFGNVLLNKNNKEYKIKNFFIINITDDIKRGIIITEGNEFIYIDNTEQVLYEFESKVKKINYTEKNPYIKSPLEIVFEDNYKMSFDAMCSMYYCIN